MTLPRLTDDVSLLANWIGPLLPNQPRDWLVMPWHEWWGTPFAEPDREREAMAAARQGNFKLLGRLKKQGTPLSAEAEALIAARLEGTFQAARGKPKKTEAQRRASNPIHAATDAVPAIQKILRQRFPGQYGLRDRAIDIAAYQTGIDRDRLAHHLRSPHRLNRRT